MLANTQEKQGLWGKSASDILVNMIGVTPSRECSNACKNHWKNKKTEGGQPQTYLSTWWGWPPLGSAQMLANKRKSKDSEAEAPQTYLSTSSGWPLLGSVKMLAKLFKKPDLWGRAASDILVNMMGVTPFTKCQDDCKTVGKARIMEQRRLRHTCQHDQGEPYLGSARIIAKTKNKPGLWDGGPRRHSCHYDRGDPP